MKIFCTGASGYIGGSVAAHLIAAGHQVTGLVRSPKRPRRFARGASSRCWERSMTEKFWRRRRRPPTSSSMRRAPITRARSLPARCARRKRQAVHPHLGIEHCRHARQGRAVGCDFRRRHADHAIARARGAGRAERVHSLPPRQGLPAGHHLPEPDLWPRPWRQSGQRAGAAADQARQKARQRGACRARREHLVERAYRRSRDALRACDREGAGGQLLFRRERREFDARSLRGDQPHAGFCGTAHGDVDGRRPPPNGARARRRIRWHPTAGCARSARGSLAGSRTRAD